MDLAVTILIQVVYWPLVVLIVRRAAHRRVPAVVAAAVVVLLAATAIAAFDPTGMLPFNRVAYGMANMAAALLLAVFPDGRFVPRWIIVPAAIEIVIQVGNLASGLMWEEVQPWWPMHFLLTWGTLFGGQLFRYVRRSSVEERSRTQWPILGLITMVLSWTLWSVGAGAGMPFEESWLANLLGAILAPSFALGLLAPRSARVDRVLGWVVAWGVWSIVVGLIGWGALALASAIGVAPWLAVMLTAVLGMPVAWATNRLGVLVVRGRRRDPLQAVVELGDRLSQTLDPRAVPDDIVRTVVDSLRLRGAMLRTDAGATVVAGVEPVLGTEGVESYPLRYSGESMGELIVSPRAGDAVLAPHDRVVLAQMCHQAGPALHAVRVVEELIEARARVVHAREEERKRLRGDLHDDLAPTFAGLGLAAAAVETFSRSGDERAADAAARLVEGLHSATRQLREVAYDLRPPVLDDRGLAAAIRERVLSPDSTPEVRVDAPGDRLDLPAAVESAALRIVQEAVANVRRHAGASCCVVTVRLDGAELEIAVEDDGIGISQAGKSGIGLRSMKERAVEVGGTLRIRRGRDGGTRVEAILPIDVRASAPARTGMGS